MSRLVRESTCPWVELSGSRVVGSRVVRESSRLTFDQSEHLHLTSRQILVQICRETILIAKPFKPLFHTYTKLRNNYVQFFILFQQFFQN